MEVSILQWNVWYKESIMNVVKLLQEVDADVICLQELTQNEPEQFKRDTLRYISENLGFGYFTSLPMTRDDVERSQYNGIFTRFKIEDTYQAWINIPQGEGGSSDEYRAYVEAKIMVGATQITVSTTHMSYTDRFIITERKKQEADNLISKLQGKAPLIFTGDLNATPQSYTVQEISRYLVNAGPSDKEKTWTTKPFEHNDFKEDELNWRLDYVFTSKDINVMSTEIIQTGYSDHLPILLKIKVDD
jgi:endonuclease/exonuclease/phosphatase family metal-dependent hydrolase